MRKSLQPEHLDSPLMLPHRSLFGHHQFRSAGRLQRFRIRGAPQTTARFAILAVTQDMWLACAAAALSFRATPCKDRRTTLGALTTRHVNKDPLHPTALPQSVTDLHLPDVAPCRLCAVDPALQTRKTRCRSSGGTNCVVVERIKSSHFSDKPHRRFCGWLPYPCACGHWCCRFSN